MHAAGGVHEDDVALAGQGGVDGVVGDRGRVAAGGADDGVAADLVGPQLELVRAGGAERVGGAEQGLAAARKAMWANLAAVVVLPEPLMPTSSATVGAGSVAQSGA